MRRFLNPKRIKIIIGIILILLFGFAIDLTNPIKNTADYHEIQKAKYEYISSALEKYHEKYGVYPETLFGGDKDGYMIGGQYQVDPLISEGIIDSYPDVGFFSFDNKRAFIEFLKSNQKDRYLFGKSGNRMCNVKWIDNKAVAPIAEKYHNLNPMAGCFYYERIASSEVDYILGIVGSGFFPFHFPYYTYDWSETFFFSGVHYVDRNRDSSPKFIGRQLD